jgi:hypothetical protein
MDTDAHRRDHAPGMVSAAVSVAIIVIVASLALTAAQSPPPAIAELAPSAVQQIKDAPSEQTSAAGEGEGGAGGGFGGSTTTTSSLPPGEAAGSAPTAPPTIERARVRRCIGNPPRQTEDPQSPPCVPYFEGDNGGATYRGVTRDTITMAIPSSDVRVNEDLQAYFNKRFEFYGRRLKLVPGGGGNDCKERKAAAVAADSQIKAFAGLDAFSGNGGNCFQTEMARRELVSAHSYVQFGENEMVPLAPYLWQYGMSFDKLVTAAGEMYCARLAGQQAVWAPDPFLKARTRTVGVVLQNTLRDTEIDLSPLKRALAACGTELAAEERISSNDDTGLASPDRAQAAMAKFKTKQITTVINLGFSFLSQNISTAADAQQYYPEWIFTTYGTLDTNTAIKVFWPQASERQSIMGITAIPPMRPWAQEPAYLAAKEVDPAVDPAADTTFLGSFTPQYRTLLLVASGIQMAGPNLTPQTFAAGLRKTRFPYPPGDPTKAGDVGFDNDHSMTDDLAEFWWSEATKSPLGYVTDGSIGAVCYVDRGARHRVGKWPRGPAAFFQGPCQSNA